MTRARRTDANHAEVREALRGAGWDVCDLSAVGRGMFDLLALKPGRLEFCEVKNPKQPPSHRQLTPAQVRFRDRLAKAGFPVRVLLSVDDARAL